MPDRASPEGSDGERRQFLDAAESVVSREGFSGLKVRTVCRQARLSIHSFYRHFSGKSDLLAAMVEKQFSMATEYLDHVIDPALPAAQRVWAHVHAFIELAFDRSQDAPMYLFATHWRGLLPSYVDLCERCIINLIAPLATALDDGRRSGVLTQSRSDRRRTSHLCPHHRHVLRPGHPARTVPACRAGGSGDSVDRAGSWGWSTDGRIGS